MEKKFSKTEIATIKRIAQNAAPFIAKRDKISKQLEEKKATIEQQVREAIAKRLEKMEAKAKEEIETQQRVIDSMQGYVKELTGYNVEDLVVRKTEGTGKIDSETGKEIMKTVFALKYPDTVIPPTDEEEQGIASEAQESQEAASEEMSEEMVAEQAQATEEAEQDNIWD